MTRAGTGNAAGSDRAATDRATEPAGAAKPDRVLPLLRGALPPALAAGALVMIGGGWLSGGPGLAGAGLGLAVVVLFSGTGLLAVRAVRDLDPMITMVVALGSYTLRIVLFGVAVALLSRLDVDRVLDRTAFLIAVLACVTAWIGGEIRAFHRMRIPTYDIELPSTEPDSGTPADSPGPESAGPESAGPESAGAGGPGAAGDKAGRGEGPA